MSVRTSTRRVGLAAFVRHILLANAVLVDFSAHSQAGSNYFDPGNLAVSRSVYDNKASNIAVGTMLPPDCASISVDCGTPRLTATNDGTYPTVFNISRSWGFRG